MKIAIHSIVPAQPSNPNRDDIGQCKTVTFGGVQRVRYSPQSRTAAIRPLLAEMIANGRGKSYRTTQLSLLVSEALDRIAPGLDDAGKRSRLDALAVLTASKARDKAETEVDKATARLAQARHNLDQAATAGKSEEEIRKLSEALKRAEDTLQQKRDAAKKDGALWLVSDAQVEAMAQVLADADADALSRVSEKKNTLRESMLEALNSSPSLDAAAFGRMFASLKESDIDAATQVCHAMGVNEFTPDVDFFTAFDDVEQQVRMMDYNYLSAPIMYAHSAVDVSLLARNMRMDPASDEFAAGIRTLVRLLALTMPRGRETKAGTVSVPTSVHLTAGKTAGTLAAAFLRPTDDDADALFKLLKFSGKLTSGLGLEFAAATLWTVHGEELPQQWSGNLRDTLDDAIDEVVAAALGV